MNIEDLRPLHHAMDRVPNAVLFTEDRHDDFILLPNVLTTGHFGTISSLNCRGGPESYTRLLRLQEDCNDEQR